MDPRIERTETILKNAFLDLADEKDIRKITVQELCKKAGINRATFYHHYADMDEYYSHLERKIISQMKSIFYQIKNIESKETIDDILVYYVDLLFENYRLNRLFYTTNHCKNILETLIEFVYENIVGCKNYEKYITDKRIAFDNEYELRWMLTAQVHGICELAFQYMEQEKDVSKVELKEIITKYITRSHFGV